MATPPIGLSLKEAIDYLILESENIDYPQLEGIDLETVFQLGFKTAVQHLENVTGDDQMTVDLIVFKGESMGERLVPQSADAEDGEDIQVETVPILDLTIEPKDEQ
jgi:hypothetical protein